MSSRVQEQGPSDTTLGSPKEDKSRRQKKSYTHSTYACAKCRQAHRRCKHDPADDPDYDATQTKRKRKRRKTTAEEEADSAQTSREATITSMQPPPPLPAALHSLQSPNNSFSSDIRSGVIDFDFPSLGASGLLSPLSGAPQQQQFPWLDNPLLPSPAPSPLSTQSLPPFQAIAGLVQSPISRSSSTVDADFIQDKSTFERIDLASLLIELYSLSSSDETFWRTTGINMVLDNLTLKHAALGVYLLHHEYETRQAEGLEHVNRAYHLLIKALEVEDPSVWQTGLYAAGLLASAQHCACEPFEGIAKHMTGLISILNKLIPRIDECRPEFRKMVMDPRHCHRTSRSAVKEFKLFADVFFSIYPDVDFYGDYEIGDVQELLGVMLDTLTCFFDLSGVEQRKEALATLLCLQRNLVRKDPSDSSQTQVLFRVIMREAVYNMLAVTLYPNRDLARLRAPLVAKMFDGESACGTLHFPRLVLAAMDRVIYEPAAQHYLQ